MTYKNRLVYYCLYIVQWRNMDYFACQRGVIVWGVVYMNARPKDKLWRSTKGGSISESFSLWLKSLKECGKFLYSEKATKFCEIFTLLLTGTTLDKSKMKISQNVVAFSEYMNFKEAWLGAASTSFRMHCTKSRFM